MFICLLWPLLLLEWLDCLILSFQDNPSLNCSRHKSVLIDRTHLSQLHEQSVFHTLLTSSLYFVLVFFQKNYLQSSYSIKCVNL